MNQVYKVVLQIPRDDRWAEDLLELRWQETEDPHGPHIKVYTDGEDAETGQPMVMIRCKHHSLEQAWALAEVVREKVAELEKLWAERSPAEH